MIKRNAQGNVTVQVLDNIQSIHSHSLVNLHFQGSMESEIWRGKDQPDSSLIATIIITLIDSS